MGFMLHAIRQLGRGGELESHDRIIEMLERIEQNQAKALKAQEEHLALARHNSSARTEHLESIDLSACRWRARVRCETSRCR